MDWSRSNRTLKPPRPICPHNSRPSKGKITICVSCICDKIDDLMEHDSQTGRGWDSSQMGQIHSSSKISEIVHNIRLINSSLDSQDDNDSGQGENVMKRIIDTITGLLKLSNDDTGLIISQGVQKICPKIGPQLRYYLMEKIVTQAQETATLTTGVLECLRFALQIEECLLIFVEKFARQILPQMFQTLRSTTTTANSVAALKPRPLSIGIDKENIQSSQSQSQSQSQSHSQKSMSIIGMGSLGSGVKEDKLRFCIPIYSILSRTLEATTKGSLHLKVANALNENINAGNGSGSGAVEILHIFIPNLTDIILNAVSYLHGSQPILIVEKVLEFLTYLMQYKSALSEVLKCNLCVGLCTALKRMLAHNSRVIQKQTITVLSNIVTTYTSSLMDAPGSQLRATSHLPEILMQVDIIHATSQMMATSDPELFSSILDFINKVYHIPMLKGKLTSLVESGLRVVSVVIQSNYSIIGNALDLFSSVLNDLNKVPVSIQQQIISVYGKLPDELDPKERLQWTKLLIFCNFHALQYHLIEYHAKVKGLLETNETSVTYLKIFLKISEVIINCNKGSSSGDMFSATENTIDIDEQFLLMQLLNIKCIPTIMVLSKCAQSEENTYIKTLLGLLLHYPGDRLKVSTNDSAVQFPQTVAKFGIEYCDEFTSSSPDGCAIRDVLLCVDGLYNTNGQWTAGAYMRILAWIRSNMELIKDITLYNLWNLNMAQIVVKQFPVHLPSLSGLWTPWLEKSNDQTAFLTRAFKSMDLDMRNWNKCIGHNFHDSLDLKLQIEAILVFYFFYYLFNMSDLEDFYCDVLENSLITLLNRTMTDVQYTSEAWDSLCTYFKTALLLISCQHIESNNQQQLVDVFELFVYTASGSGSSPSADFTGLGRMVTFCGKVFNKLIFWNLFPAKIIVQFLDKWFIKEPDEFRNFFLTSDYTSNLGLRCQIIEQTAYGSESTSNFMVDLVQKKQVKWIDDTESLNLLQITTDIVRGILAGNRQGTSPKKLSNLLALSLTCDHVFNQAILDTFPSKVFSDFIRILMKYRQFENIRCRSLHFIFKCLKNHRERAVINICLDNNNFLEFLNKRICQDIRKIRKINFNLYEEIYLAYEIVALFVVALDNNGEKLREDNHIISWCLSSVIPNLQYHSLNVASLKLVTALIRKNFKSPAVLVKETNPQEIADLLIKMQFISQNLIRKGFMRDIELAVWKFLYELLRFTEREPGKVLQERKIGMDQWYLPLLTIFIIMEPDPLSLPVECLTFVLKWLKITGKRRKHWDAPLRYQIFNRANTIGQMYTKLSSTLSQQKEMTQDNSSVAVLNSDIDQRNTPDLPERLALIQKITTVCSIITVKSIDWFNQEESALGDSAESSIADDDDSDCRSIYSETCSESELNLD